MSVLITEEDLTDEILDIIKEKCIVKDAEKNLHQVFRVSEDGIYVPMNVAISNSFPVTMFEKPSVDFEFKGTLLTAETDEKGRDQDVVVKDALKVLNDYNSVLLSLHTGFGKTLSAIYLACKLGLKILWICGVSKTFKQTKEAFERLTGRKAQIVKGKKLDPDADMYIMGVLKASGFSQEDFEEIGTVIYDEAHMVTVTACTNVLLNVCPHYLIGLTATYNSRSDGLYKLLYPYFGKPRDMFIFREEKKPFVVNFVHTPFKPRVEYMWFKGKERPNWTMLQTSLAEKEDRQKLAVKLAIEHRKEGVLIITARNEEREKLVDLFTQEEVFVDQVYAGKDDYDNSCEVLIGHFKKLGVGFDDPTRKILIILMDMKDVKQCEGRIRCKNNTVYDFVDDYPTLKKHAEIREKWYKKRGATINHLNM